MKRKKSEVNEASDRIVGETDDARPTRASGWPESRYTIPFSVCLLFLPHSFDDLECITTLVFRGTVVDRASLFPPRDSEPRFLAPQVSNAKTSATGSLDSARASSAGRQVCDYSLSNTAVVRFARSGSRRMSSC